MADKPIKNRGLGRGLSALLSDVAPKDDAAKGDADRREVSLPIDRLHPNPDQAVYSKVLVSFRGTRFSLPPR